LILKNVVKILYTGLKRKIGSPEDYGSNQAKNSFPTHFDLRIPTEETD
jgi:hypothetical protein